MRTRGWVSILASAMALMGAAALVLVSGGSAGTGPGSTQFAVFGNPKFLTITPPDGIADGFVLARYQPPLGGAAVQVVITITVSKALNPSATTGCSDTSATALSDPRVFTCTIGTVQGGEVVKRFLLLTDPVIADAYTITAAYTADNGSGGKGNGGGKAESGSDTDLLTVVNSSNTTRAGSCTGDASTNSAGGSVQTSDVENANASPALGLPAACTGLVYVGVNSAPASAQLVSQVSFATIALTDGSATWTIEIPTIEKPFSRRTVEVDFDYSEDSPNSFTPDPYVDCVNGAIPAGETLCLLSFEQVGPGARIEFLVLGSGGDPGAGVG